MRSVRTILGRSLSEWRNLVCLSMMVILPVSLMADDTGAVLLRSNGGVLVNKNQAPASTALFPDDLVETQQGTARLEAPGSTADINQDTAVQFEGDELVVEHGTVSVNTSRLLRVRVGCVTITPVNADWTHYDVKDMDGKITVSALKNDVYLEGRSSNPQKAGQKATQPAHSDRMIVREGEQKSREEKCDAADLKEPGHLAGRGAIMNSPYVQWPAAGVIVGLTCWALCNSDNPVSPSAP